MFSWVFGEWDYLVIIVSLIYAKEVYIDDDRFHKIIEDYDESTVNKIYNTIKEKPLAIQLFDRAIIAMQKGELRYAAKEGELALNEKILEITQRPALIKVYPLEFLDWLIKNNFQIPNFLIKAAQEKEIIDNFKKQKVKLQKKELKLLLQEPLWYLPTAILYLNGFQTCGDASIDQKCVERNPNLNKLYNYALDAKDTKNLNLSSKWIEQKWYYRIQPSEFIKWVRTLNIDFPIFKILDERPKSFHSKEIEIIEKYTTPYLELMKRAIIEFNITDKNQPPKKKLEAWLEKQDPSLGARKSSYLATFIRLPEMQQGGHWRSNKVKNDTPKTKA